MAGLNLIVQEDLQLFDSNSKLPYVLENAGLRLHDEAIQTVLDGAAIDLRNTSFKPFGFLNNSVRCHFDPVIAQT